MKGAVKISPAQSFDLRRMTLHQCLYSDTWQAIEAYDGEREIARMELQHRGGRSLLGEIVSVRVEHEYRRKGVATALWNEALLLHEADHYCLKPSHSTSRTDAGDAWARSVSARLPRRIREESWD